MHHAFALVSERIGTHLRGWGSQGVLIPGRAWGGGWNTGRERRNFPG